MGGVYSFLHGNGMRKKKNIHTNRNRILKPIPTLPVNHIITNQIVYTLNTRTISSY